MALSSSASRRPRAMLRTPADDVALLLHRTVAGGFLLPHGLAEWLGWFGGPGLTGFAGQLQHWGLPAAAPIPFGLAALQIILGTLLVLGAGTRISALLATMLLLVIALAHASLGWFHGLEHPLLWSAMLLVAAIWGPGRFSIDCWLDFTEDRLGSDGNGNGV